MKYFLSWCLLLLMSGCSFTMSENLDAVDVPERPEAGYQRKQYLNPYISFWQNPLETFPIELNKRNPWVAQNPTGFTSLYPKFSLGFNFFQNTGEGKQFSFAERLFFADVFDMIRFVVNSPVFEQEMLNGVFFENDGMTPRSPKVILDEIKNINFSISLVKRPLDDNVLAEATVGGFSHIIWVRDDTDYTKGQVQEMALIILHEVTHNMGYFHSSGVNYGVHDPLREAIRLATPQQVANYIAVTPYYEDLMIRRVRTLSGESLAQSSRSSSHISCNFTDIFGDRDHDHDH
ncbi:MAG: hypothetical protein ACRC9L_02420 [Brevinema sp.]